MIGLVADGTFGRVIRHLRAGGPTLAGPICRAPSP